MVNILAWLLFGMGAGWVASRLFQPAPGSGALLHIAAGAMGAVVGGVVFLIFDTTPLSGFSLWGLLCSLVGAAITIGIAQVVIGRPV
jgi:uncharacterized membrane protein YeaQ/YmgE (transglycosylase-associated protein family)